MTVGLIDSGLHPKLLKPGKTGLRTFSAWTWEVGTEGWFARAQISTPEEIAHWWLEEGFPDPCWDTCGHGSQICRTIAEGGEEISLVSAQILDSRGQGSEGLLLAAWDWLTGWCPDVINFSLGCLPAHPEEWLERAETCRLKGVRMFAAAGREPSYPAALPGVTAVGDPLLQWDERLEPGWKKSIGLWVPEEDFPHWAEKPSSSLACAAAVRNHIRMLSGRDRNPCLI